MKFALVDGKKSVATKGANGLCPICKKEVNAYCGEINVDHWRHKRKSDCDHWWETETEWHRNWKEQFPDNWQEVVLQAKTGEKHIADVRTEEGWVLEFQHSFLNPEERRARNAFYPKLIWVVNGLRRPTDIKQFENIIAESTVINEEPLIAQVHFTGECRLLREWHDSNALIFFDFQEVKASKQIKLWFLFPKTSNSAYLTPFPRKGLIELHKNNEFDEFVRNEIWPTCKNLITREQNIRKNIQQAKNLQQRAKPIPALKRRKRTYKPRKRPRWPRRSRRL